MGLWDCGNRPHERADHLGLVCVIATLAQVAPDQQQCTLDHVQVLRSPRANRAQC
jgi:hypothetical protein